MVLQLIVFCFLLICLMFIFLLGMFCFLFRVFCVFVLFCVLLLPMYTVVYFLLVYKFTDNCHRGETPIAVNKYIISCIIHTRILVHIHTHAGERIFGIFSGMAQSMECVCEVKTLISLRWPYSPNVSCNSASVKYHTSYAPTICLKIW